MTVKKPTLVFNLGQEKKNKKCSCFIMETAVGAGKYIGYINYYKLFSVLRTCGLDTVALAFTSSIWLFYINIMK